PVPHSHLRRIELKIRQKMTPAMGCSTPSVILRKQQHVLSTSPSPCARLERHPRACVASDTRAASSDFSAQRAYFRGGFSPPHPQEEPTTVWGDPLFPEFQLTQPTDLLHG